MWAGISVHMFVKFFEVKIMKMKGLLKKVLCLFFCTIFVLSSFVACRNDEDEDYYMTKGQFFSLFIEQTNLYSENHTMEELKNGEGYEIESEIMLEWELLDKGQVKNVTGYVTKEIVADACVNFMTYRKTCDDIKVKDILFCHDKQAVKDAVGMGIFELNKGYFDGNEKMTAEECLNAINRMFKVEANSQYEKGELKVSYKDNVQVIDKSVKIYDYKEFDAVSTESIDTDGGERPKTVFCDKEINTETEFLDGPANRRKISFQISKAAYQQNIEAYEVGKIVVMPKAGAQQSLTRGLSYSKPISVEITDVNYVGVMVTITGYDCACRNNF